MPAADFVLLKVYDILGNEVAVLVSGNQNAGSYSVDFNFNSLNSSVLSSGIYFYKLTARKPYSNKIDDGIEIKHVRENQLAKISTGISTLGITVFFVLTFLMKVKVNILNDC